MPRYAWNKGKKNNWSQVMCLGCGETFLKRNSEIARSKGRHYCSHNCAISEPLFKVCKECGETLPISNFYKQGISKLTGRRYYLPRCKKCEAPRKLIAQQKRRAVKVGKEASFSVEDWKQVLQVFGNKCSYCGKVLMEACQDHFVPLSKGGHHIMGNVLPSCRSCNSSKNNTDPQEWLTHTQYHQLSTILGSLG